MLKIDPRRLPSGPVLVCALVLLYVVGIAVARALVFAWTWDHRDLDMDLLDAGWKIQLVWRAARGEWAGLDFPYPLGPLYQLIGWAGSGFAYRSPGLALAGYQLGFGAVVLALAAWLSRRAVANPWPRVVVFTLLVAMVLPSEPSAVRAFVITMVLLLYVPPTDAELDRSPTIGAAAAAAGALSAAGLLSFDRLVVGGVAVTLAALYELGARWLHGLPRRPAVARYGLFLGALLGWQLALAALAGLVGADYLASLGAQREIAGMYVLVMALPGEAALMQLTVAYYLVLGGIAVVLAARRTLDVAAGAWLVGSLPSVVTALVRSDVGHVYMATTLPASIVLLAAARQLEQRRAARHWVAAAACLFFLGWLGRGDELKLGEWSPAQLQRLAAVRRGDLAPESSYHGTIERVVDWVRRRRAESPCFGLYLGGDVAHALVDVPGPTVLAGMPDTLPREIARTRCPYFVMKSFAFDHADRLPDGFLEVARLYEPVEALGPDVWAMRMRPQEAPEVAVPLEVPALGERVELRVPGVLDLPLGRPVDATHVLRLTLTLEVPGVAPLVGAAPVLSLVFVDSTGASKAASPVRGWVYGEDGTQIGSSRLRAYAIGERTESLVAVHPERVDRRWLAGLAPRAPRAADRLRIVAERTSVLTPPRVALTIHRIEQLVPGAPARPEPAGGACERELDLRAAALAGRAFARNLRYRIDDHLRMRPNAAPEAEAELFFPVVPCGDSCLAGELALDAREAGSQGLVFRLHLYDREVRVELLERPVAPGAPPARFEIPLGSWRDREILLRLNAASPVSGDAGGLVVRDLRLAPCSGGVLVTALAEGRARVIGGRPTIEGTSIFMHPAGPGDPPAALEVPTRPSPETCFDTHLRVGSPPGKGDGVIFFGEMVRGAETAELFRRVVPSGAEDHVRVPLSAWADDDVVLRIGTLPGGSAEYDWASWIEPRIAPCPPE